MAETNTKQFDPFEKSALYKQNIRRWEQEQDFAEATKDVLMKYIRKFSDKEDTEDFAYRQDMVAPLDMLQDAIDLREQSLWRSPPVRKIADDSQYKDLLTTLMTDADTSGTPINEFMRKIYRQALISGSDIVVQMTRAEGAVETKADAITAGLRPFLLQVLPNDRFAWSCDGGGAFQHARYFMGEEFTGEGSKKTVSIFLTLTGNNWIVYTVTSTSEGEGKSTKITSVKGTYENIDVTPIIKAYFKESAKPGQCGVPLSLITRPAIIAYVLLNLKSQVDSELLAAIASYFMSGTTEAPDSFGPNRVNTASDPDAKLTVIQSDVKHIVEKREWVVLYIREIMRLLKFRGTMASMEGNAGSGVKLALEFSDLNNELLAWAARLEELEIESMRMAVNMATGANIQKEGASEELGYTVRYAREFNLEPVGELLAHLKSLSVDSGFAAEQVPALTKEILKKLANALMQHGSPEFAEAVAQIEELTFGDTELDNAGQDT